MKTQPGIFRTKLKFEGQFFLFANEWIRDPQLSYKAKGLLAYLWSHEPGYTITLGQMVRQSTTGERAIREAMVELKKAGYLRTERTTDSRGYNAGLAYYIDDPKNPELQNPTLDNPTLDNAVALENNLTKNTKKQENPVDDSFDDFWNYYPKKVARADAVRAWKRAIKRKPAIEIIELAKQYSESKLPAYEYIPNGSTWLNNDRWEDVEPEQKKLPTPIWGRIK